MSHPIDRYLARLDRALTVGRRRRHRIVDETRDHLLDATARHEAAGEPPAHASRLAIAGFGPAEDIAHAFDPEPTPARLASAIGLHLLLLASLAFLAIGLSGAIAGAIGVTLGPDTISGAAPATLDATDCTRLAATEPGAASCAEAWSWHALEESVLYRGLPGLLGAVVALAALWTARAHIARATWARRTTQATALAGVVAFSLLCALATTGALGALDPAEAALPRGASQTTAWWLSFALALAAAAIASGAAFGASRHGHALSD